MSHALYDLNGRFLSNRRSFLLGSGAVGAGLLAPGLFAHTARAATP